MLPIVRFSNSDAIRGDNPRNDPQGGLSPIVTDHQKDALTAPAQMLPSKRLDQISPVC